jgi:phage recombination protein Bet
MNKSLEKKDEYSKDVQLINTVRACIFKGSTDAEMALYFFKCQEVGVHPMSKLIIPIVYSDRDGNRSVSFISTIDFFRAQSEDSGDFSGIDPIEYVGETITEYDPGPDKEKIQYTHPDMAICKVYRTGFDKPFTGVARWSEFYPGDKKGMMWRTMSFHQLGKCAEAQARRLAWPKKLNQLYTAEEMERGFQALADGSTSKKPNVTMNDVHVTDAPPVDYGDVGDLLKPTEEERSSGKLVNEKQGYLMVSECKKNGVEIGAVAAAAKVQNVFWLTWQKSCKTNFNVMLELVKNKPNSFARFSQAAQASQTNGKAPLSQSDSKAPTVMGADEFSSLVESLALQAGITVADGLKECAGVDCVEDVLPEAQSKIVDWFTARAEQPGA